MQSVFAKAKPKLPSINAYKPNIYDLEKQPLLEKTPPRKRIRLGTIPPKKLPKKQRTKINAEVPSNQGKEMQDECDASILVLQPESTNQSNYVKSNDDNAASINERVREWTARLKKLFQLLMVKKKYFL